VATLEVGRVCMKTAGKEAGQYCVVIKKMDDNFVFITGPKVLTGIKRRRCNVEHLEPTQYSVKIKDDEGEKEIINAYEKSGLLAKLNLAKPSPEIVKEAEKEVKKAAKVEKAKKEVKEEKKIEKEKNPKKKPRKEKKTKKK
jgi:large subunit ribosomal protein L14e